MVESLLKENTQDSVISQVVPLDSRTARRIKPRGLIIKANEKDLHKLKELIETNFPEVQIVCITTGPATSILRVTKSIPFETKNSSVLTFFAIQ